MTIIVFILSLAFLGEYSLEASEPVPSSDEHSVCLDAETEKLFLISLLDAVRALRERLPEETDAALKLNITLDDLGPQEQETVAIHPETGTVVFNRPVIESACRAINEALQENRNTLAEILGFQSAPTLIHEAAHEIYDRQWGNFETTQEEEIEAFGWELLAFLHLREYTPQSHWIPTKIIKFEERLADMWEEFGPEGIEAYVMTDPVYRYYPSLQKRQDVMSRMVAYEETKKGSAIWTDPDQIEELNNHYQHVICDLAQIHCLQSGGDCQSSPSACRQKNGDSKINIYENEEEIDIPQ